MNLPKSDIIDVGRLSRIFDNKSESYKLFWFKAICGLVSQGKCSLAFGEIVDNMIADAWYMVTEYHLNLGPSDALEKACKRLSLIDNYKPGEKKDTILKAIGNCEDKELQKLRKNLILNVPYRLQAPFLDSMKGQKAWNVGVKKLQEEINRQDRLMYYFDHLGTTMETRIVMSDDWAVYIAKNYPIIEGWIELNLINYLQKRNPSVPGIADKLRPPQARNLRKVTDLWKALVEAGSFNEIYGGNHLDKTDISIDHFVPWSYVAHDELWNLHPTLKSINSSKSNNLPDWDLYFPLLGQLEYESYQMIWKNEKAHKLFDKCADEHLNNVEIRGRLYRQGMSQSEFTERLGEVIQPVYKAAENSGFGHWRWEN